MCSVSVQVFNPSAFWELHWTILSGKREGKIFHCPAPSHLEDFPGRLGPRDWISNYYACSRLLRDLHFNVVFSEALPSFTSECFVEFEVLFCSFYLFHNVSLLLCHFRIK